MSIFPLVLAAVIAIAASASFAGADGRSALGLDEPVPTAPAGSAASIAADDGGASDGWHFSLTPYLWVPAMNGNVTVRGHDADVDMSVGDTLDAVFDNFDGALVLQAEAQHDQLSIFADAMYLSLEADATGPGGNTATADLSQGFFEVGGGYAVVDTLVGSSTTNRFRLEPIAGARVTYVDMSLTIPAFGVDASGDHTWVDGFVGARASLDLAPWCSVIGRADIGAGQSDLTWSAQAGLDFHVTNWFSIGVGYSALSIDYSHGDGANAFAYDMLLQGPYASLNFTF